MVNFIIFINFMYSRILNIEFWFLIYQNFYILKIILQNNFHIPLHKMEWIVQIKFCPPWNSNLGSTSCIRGKRLPARSQGPHGREQSTPREDADANTEGRRFESNRGHNLFFYNSLYFMKWKVKNCFVKLILNIKIKIIIKMFFFRNPPHAVKTIYSIIQYIFLQNN